MAGKKRTGRKTNFSKQSVNKFLASKEVRGFFRPWFIRIFLVIAVTILFVVFLQNFLPPQIPLFYGLPKGEEQLASTLSLLIPSLATLAIAVLNFSLALILEEDFIQKALVYTVIICLFFSTITTLKIILLVGNF